MNVELLVGRNLIRRAEMQQVPRAAALRKVAGVFNERVRWFGKLTIQEKSGLSCKIARITLGCWPVHCELPSCTPVRR